MRWKSQVRFGERAGETGWPRCRNRAPVLLHNANKYLEANQGIHWLSSYEMDLEDNTALVANPARKAARENLKKATDELAEAQRALGISMDKDCDAV
ncbi:hypothetical protein, partial [Ferrimicrobium acidiphilum]|uniref:hypothetical protein n=1 Tax=Ferrimicrobium acidiphilum TaxID=121039 RepID=UPI0023F0CBB1